MIQNPILPGFHPDPCICRKGDDYYLAVSSFEWFPGIPIYHSRDLKHWELITHVLTDESQLSLGMLPSGQGIWAPDLSYDEEEDLFYVVYGRMAPKGMNIDNFLVTAKEITGPWSEPVYLQSNGFDASLFHDRDGRKWLLSLDWERREGYYKPGAICLAEYSPREKKLLDYPCRIWYGGTKRGWVEGPHLYRRGEYYYIVCAEGGTGYHHCAAVGRSKSIWGPYESDPQNPVLTSSPWEEVPDELEPDKLRKFYNPAVTLQKAGHMSVVDCPNGETFAVHLCARPLLPELRCTLGRETAIQKMTWTPDGWLRKKNGSPLPDDACEEASLPETVWPALPERDSFARDGWQLRYYAPRHMPESFASVDGETGALLLRGQETLDSYDRVSFLARKLPSLHVTVTARMIFSPVVHKHTAGIALYYDNLNYLYPRRELRHARLGDHRLPVQHSAALLGRRGDGRPALSQNRRHARGHGAQTLRPPGRQRPPHCGARPGDGGLRARLRRAGLCTGLELDARPDVGAVRLCDQLPPHAGGALPRGGTEDRRVFHRPHPCGREDPRRLLPARGAALVRRHRRRRGRLRPA